MRTLSFLSRFRLCLTLLCLGLLSVPYTVPSQPASDWKWIWAAEPPRAPETYFFRQKFRLPRAPLSAQLLIAADDLFLAYVNGSKQPVAQGNDWTVVQEFDLTRFLRAGQNVLAIEATNTDGPGGLLYKLTVKLPGDKTLVFTSDAKVKINRRVPPVWTALDVDDSRWPSAKELAPANGGVWGPLHGAPMPDPTRIVRLWDIHAGGGPSDDPYFRARNIGDRMLLSSSVGSLSEMQILAGAGFTLFQSDSDHLSTEETARGQWNFRDAEAALHAARRLGLDWCYFPHYAFPPEWSRASVPFTRLQCLEHGEPVQAFSPWDPAWAGFIDHGYEALARAFGAKGKGAAKPDGNPKPNTPNPKSDVVAALCVGIHGDFGEAGLMMGARVSEAVPGQKEDWQQRFGNLHNHLGWWCADPLARADFQATMLDKYGGLAPLNAAWKRDYKTAEEITYPDKPRPESRREWLDFVTWYQDGVTKAMELNLRAARKHFPTTPLTLLAGFPDENPRGGNDNSLIPKIAARYGAAVRSTHGGFKPFAENAVTMLGRLGSACRFYGVPFWTESLSGLTLQQEVERIFEAVSQGAAGHFDWKENAVTGREIYYRYGKFLRVEKPVVDVAMFYPAMAQKLRPDQGYALRFASACAYLRDAANFDIVDDRMVLDGCLSRYRVLALWEGTMADQATLDKIRDWVNEGGVLVAYDFGKIANFEGDTGWFADMFGYVNQIAPAKLTERYVGTVPGQYRLQPGSPDSADYLVGDWYNPEMEGSVLFRWTGANASIRLPVNPEKNYVLAIRAYVPPEAAPLKRSVVVNGHEIGRLGSPGDVTYRFPLSAELLAENAMPVLSFQSETFRFSELLPNGKDRRTLGARILSVTLQEEGASENGPVGPPAGQFKRELDLRRLKSDWTRRYGKGLTIYFPATRQLLGGYIEVVRQSIYHLSEIDPGRRDALPVDNEFDGTYATLFTDKILVYNPKDTAVTKTVTLSSETFAAWRGEVAIPTETTWKLTLDPHSISAIYLAPPPVELPFECEKFLDPGAFKILTDATCSPGRGPTCVRLTQGGAISTSFNIETPGNYALYTRSIRNGKLEPLDILLDGQTITPLNAKAGQTLLSAVIPLTRGKHTLTLRARREVRADYILLTNDPNIAGYDFAVRTAAVE